MDETNIVCMCHKSFHQLGRIVFTIVEYLFETVYPPICVALIAYQILRHRLKDCIGSFRVKSTRNLGSPLGF